MYKYFIIIILATLASISLSAEVLQENEAIIILGIEHEEPRQISKLKFEEFNSGETFTIKAYRKIKPEVRAAGNYYLKSIKSMFSNVPTTIFEKPADIEMTFKVYPGTVTYIGNWKFDNGKEKHNGLHWYMSRFYKDEYLSTVIEKHSFLTQYPLMIATADGKIFPYSWNKVITKKSSATP
jgi:hypothetical protein